MLKEIRAITSISCSNCHAQGLLPVVDEVRQVALANAIDSGLNNDEVEQLEAVYPLAPELASIIESDSVRFQSALAAAGLLVEGRDPVSSVFLRFDQAMRFAPPGEAPFHGVPRPAVSRVRAAA